MIDTETPATATSRRPVPSRPRRHAGSALVVLFALVLAVPWLVRGSGGASENRDVAPVPHLGPGNVLDDQAYREVDAALRDRLTLRAEVVEAVASLGYDPAGVSLNKRVHVGEGGQLFVTDDFVLPCRDRLDVDGLAQSLDGLSRLGQKRPGAVTFVVLPNKSTVMPEALGSLGGPLMRCSEAQRARFARLASARPGLVLDFAPEAVTLHRAQPGDELYTKVDTHWTPPLAATFSRELVLRLAHQTGAGDVRWSEPGTDLRVHYGDLTSLLGAGRQYQWRDKLVARRPGAVTTRAKLPVPGARNVWRTRTTGAPVIGGRTLFVYDSFIAARGFGNDYGEPLLIPYFADVTWVHWEDLRATIAAGELPDVDRVVLESVERGAGGIVNGTVLAPDVEEALRSAVAAGAAG